MLSGTVGVVAGAERGGGDPQLQMRGLQDTQLTQLEHLITQQRKAHQRMRHVLREAEKVRGYCDVGCGVVVGSITT